MGLLTACSNEAGFIEEAQVPQPSAENAIAFSVDLESVTRAANEKTALAGEEAIGVFACYTGDVKYNLSTVTPNYMYNQKVTYDGSTTWTYTPVKYWPNTADGDGGHKDYVSFFAYYPYTAAAGTEGIIGFSSKDAAGDPWLVYQLPANAPTDQTDLLYGVKDDGSPLLDMQKQSVTGEVSFSLRHALACVGDNISICLSSELYSALGGTKSLYVNKVTINYKNLTNKARLILNSNSSPNWQPVISGDYISNRKVEITSGTYVAAGTSHTALSTNPGEISSGKGLFYIPIHLGAVRQEAEITVEYTVKDGDTTTNGSVSNSYILKEDAQQKESINIVLGKSLIP